MAKEFEKVTLVFSCLRLVSTFLHLYKLSCICSQLTQNPVDQISVIEIAIIMLTMPLYSFCVV